MSVVARRYYVRAVEQLRRGDLETAEGDLRAALEMAPSYVDARVAYAALLARTGDPPRAAQLLRDALASERRPRARISLQRTLGDVLIAAGDYRGAEEHFFQAAQAGDRAGVPQTDLHDRLARLRAKTGRYADALDELLAAARAPALTSPTPRR